jgi:hypothetical protein
MGKYTAPRGADQLEEALSAGLDSLISQLNHGTYKVSCLRAHMLMRILKLMLTLTLTLTSAVLHLHLSKSPCFFAVREQWLRGNGRRTSTVACWYIKPAAIQWYGR